MEASGRGRWGRPSPHATCVAWGPRFEVEEDGGDDGWVGEEGEDPHGAAATTLRAVPRAEERQDLIDPCEEHGPADACGAGGARRLVQGVRDGMGRLGIDKAGCLGRGSIDDDDGGAQVGMGREDAVVAVAVHARRWHEGDEALEKLERR